MATTRIPTQAETNRAILDQTMQRASGSRTYTDASIADEGFFPETEELTFSVSPQVVAKIIGRPFRFEDEPDKRWVLRSVTVQPDGSATADVGE